MVKPPKSSSKGSALRSSSASFYRTKHNDRVFVPNFPLVEANTALVEFCAGKLGTAVLKVSSGRESGLFFLQFFFGFFSCFLADLLSPFLTDFQRFLHQLRKSRKDFLPSRGLIKRIYRLQILDRVILVVDWNDFFDQVTGVHLLLEF